MGDLVLLGGSPSAIIAETEPVEGVAVSAASAFDKLRRRLLLNVGEFPPVYTSRSPITVLIFPNDCPIRTDNATIIGGWSHLHVTVSAAMQKERMPNGRFYLFAKTTGRTGDADVMYIFIFHTIPPSLSCI